MMMAVLLNLVWFCRFCDIDATEIDHYSTLLIMIIIYSFFVGNIIDVHKIIDDASFVWMLYFLSKVISCSILQISCALTTSLVSEPMRITLSGCRYFCLDSVMHFAYYGNVSLKIIWKLCQMWSKICQLQTFYMKINRDWKKDWKRVPCSHTNDLKTVLSSTETLALNNFRTLGGIEL